MRELKLWKFICDGLKQNQPVMLMCVLESKGSSPGRQGFKMAITKNELCGSIGGGIMEFKFVEMAREWLREGVRNSVLKRQFHQSSASKDRSGMICSGEQTVFFYEVSYSDLDTVERIIFSLENYQNGLLELFHSGIRFSGKQIPGNDFHFEMNSEDDFLYKEKTGFRNQLFIVGGGHCALALSRLMTEMDFLTRIFEDRPEINTLLENDFIHQKVIVKDYAELNGLIPPGENHYVVIMTFGYRTDDDAVRALIHQNYRYFGVLGSKSKMEQLFKEWRADGIPEERLGRISSPAGLQIKSETPVEIAVSIAAEMIKIKNS